MIQVGLPIYMIYERVWKWGRYGFMRGFGSGADMATELWVLFSRLPCYDTAVRKEKIIDSFTLKAWQPAYTKRLICFCYVLGTYMYSV